MWYTKQGLLGYNMNGFRTYSATTLFNTSFRCEYSWAIKPQFREAGYRHSCFVVPHCISLPYTSATEGSAWSRNRSRPCRHAMRSSLYLICDQGIITKQVYASYRYRSTGINGTTFLEWWCNKHRILHAGLLICHILCPLMKPGLFIYGKR